MEAAALGAAQAGSIEIFAAAEGQVIELEDATSPCARRRLARRRSCRAGFRADRPDRADRDRPRSARVLKAAIAADGSPLLAAADVHSLLRMAAEERPAVVILPRRFAGQDALELCRAIRALDPADPTCRRSWSSPRARTRWVDAGNRAGVTDWLLWPFKETYARTRMQSGVLREPCRWARRCPRTRPAG